MRIQVSLAGGEQTTFRLPDMPVKKGARLASVSNALQGLIFASRQLISSCQEDGRDFMMVFISFTRPLSIHTCLLVLHVIGQS